MIERKYKKYIKFESVDIVVSYTKEDTYVNTLNNFFSHNEERLFDFFLVDRFSEAKREIEKIHNGEINIRVSMFYSIKKDISLNEILKKDKDCKVLGISIRINRTFSVVQLF
jgi:hypothetical protein